MFSYRLQTASVYLAENRTAGFSHPDLLQSLTVAQEWLDKLYESQWFRRRYELIKDIRVVESPHHDRHHGWEEDWIAFIAICRYPVGKQLVLHELAHAVSIGIGHDAFFCVEYLALVKHFLGLDAWRDLRDQFVEAGVRFARPSQLEYLQMELCPEAKKMEMLIECLDAQGAVAVF